MYQAFVIIQWIGIAIIILEMIYLFYQKSSKYQVTMMLMEITTLVIVVSYLFELKATSIDEAMLAVKLGYIGKPFALLSVVVFAYQYANIKVPKWVIPSLALLNVFIIVIVFTNESHHLYYSTVEFVDSGDYPHLKMKSGPLYYLYMAVIACYSLAVLSIATREYKKAKTTSEKKQSFLIAGIVLSSGIGLLIYLLNLTGGYDTTVPACVIATIFIVILLVKYRLYDSLTYAMYEAMNKMNKGVIILDNRDYLVFYNSFVTDLFPDIKDKNKQLGIIRYLENSKTIEINDHYYTIENTNINKKRRNYGRTIEINDVTEEENYQKRLKKEVFARTKELQNIQNNIIVSFANMVEARDGSTGTHIKNTSLYVKIVAEALSKTPKYKFIITEKYLSILVNVAPLHDLGKISISDAILQKPGRLTDEEFNQIKSHTVIGADLIEDNLRGVEKDEYVSMAKDVALYHHEKWDGTGYPTKISGEDIPLSARIMAIADVYDALISKRCYKPPMSIEKAVEIINEGKNKHFDPDVVDAFLASLDKIKEEIATK